MTESAPVVPLTSQNTDRAGVVLGRAFRDDPLWANVFPDPQSRPDTLVAMFTAVAKATLGAGGVGETNPGPDGVALWLPPGKNVGLWAMLKSRFALPRFAMRLPGPERKRMLAVLGQLGERKKALVPEPHWYLSAIGVDPDQQGNGLGSTLVRSGLSRADSANIATYLETETPGNVEFYERFGFAVVEEVTARGLDLPVWLMIRPARSSPG